MWNHSLDIYSLLATEVFFVQFLYSFIIIAIISSKIHPSFFFFCPDQTSEPFRGSVE